MASGGTAESERIRAEEKYKRVSPERKRKLEEEEVR